MSAASRIKLISNVQGLRQWRHELSKAGKSVGFVPTMGALHQGHLSLVQRSLDENDHTIVSIFVNPAQFAPHEDFAIYPRTVDSDVEQLLKLNSNKPSLKLPSFDLAASATNNNNNNKLSEPKSVSSVFVPPVEAMYPSGISHNVDEQVGTFVEVKGFSHQMDGKTRPTFFRGVATVVLKLFNLVQPTRAYFGTKDIQQGIVLRRMLTDLHLTQPSVENCLLVPTARDTQSGLALSSRNVHILENEKPFATSLYKSLRAGQEEFDKGTTASAKDILDIANERLQDSITEAAKNGVEIKKDYIGLNDSVTLNELDEEQLDPSKGAILSGAMWIGQKKTRLIDNILLGPAFNRLTGL